MRHTSKKRVIFDLPLIGYLARSAVFLLSIPKTQERINQAVVDSKAVQKDQARVEKNFESLQEELKQGLRNIKATQKKLDKAAEMNQDLQYQIRMLQKNKLTGSHSPTPSATLADNHLLDKFYVNFEDIFRGTEEDIYGRLKVYLPRINKLAENRGSKLDVLDIGCGRGEFLKLMRDEGHNAKGLDLNAMMVKRAKENGFDIEEQDALSYLMEQKSGTLDAITGFQLIEHIPFDQLLTIFSECYRVLRPGGFILFETPNPENVTVGSWRFYYDPSHLHPLPPDMIAFAVRSCGFEKSEIIRLHEEEQMPGGLSKHDQKVHTRLFGPLDYSVFGEKWDEVIEL